MSSRARDRRSPVVRRQRRAARIALYVSLVVVVASALGALALLERTLAHPDEEAWSRIDFAALPEVRRLQGYLKIDTTPDHGDELRGAAYLAEPLRAAGVEVTIERVGPRKANLIAVLDGDDPRAIVLHSHLDVESVEHPEAWDEPPFGGRIRGPWIYGRGVYDMKSLAIAQLEALLDVARRGRPRRSVILLATSGEESGSELGTRWILRNRPDLVRRFWAVFTEGGAVEARSPSDVKYWGIEVAQKRVVELELCASDRAPLAALYDLVAGRGQSVDHLRLTEPVADFLASYAPTRDLASLRRALEEPEETLSDPADFARLPLILQAMFRDEVAVFPPERAPGGGYRMIARLILLPGSDVDAVRRDLLPDWLTFGLTQRWSEDLGTGRMSPLDHPAYRALLAVLARSRPGVVAGPLFLPITATDARFFRARGIPAYGFSPFVFMASETWTLHEPNERISLPGYVDGVELYRSFLRAAVE